MVTVELYSYNMPLQNNEGYFNDVQICWKDSPKAFPVQVKRDLIKSNICAKLIREMDHDRSSPKKPEDSPLHFRSTLLLPRKKLNSEFPDDIKESPKSRARKRLRSISKFHGKILEINRGNQGIIKQCEEDEKCNENKPSSCVDSQINLVEELNITISQNTFLSELLKKNRFTSTPKMSTGDTRDNFNVRETPSPFSDDEIHGDKKNDDLCRKEEKLIQNENLAISFDTSVNVKSSTNSKEDYMRENSKEAIKSPFKYVRTPIKMSILNKKQHVIHTCGFNDNSSSLKKEMYVDDKCDYKPESPNIFPTQSTTKTTTCVAKSNPSQLVYSKNKNNVCVEDDFYDDDISGFIYNSQKDVDSKGSSGVWTMNNNRNLKINVNNKSITKENLVVEEKSVQDNDANILKNEKLLVNKLTMDANMCKEKQNFPENGKVEDPIKDDFYDDFDDDFLESINESMFINHSGEKENTRKRKSGSSFEEDKSKNLKKPQDFF
ncbi:Hypothetical protein SRAE_2000474300 [Strongyloides ratti]|uniref:Uncharacterized protein n=1 Tax=Strongyloides ratti TaxID=34506 RepID=A0A090LPI6_STRRB|nr:Hypothetical protein SRAE_2000474300 [Strongyloides ratti]CEF70104.1 Hypothetical protein SRAE_2000474300 [Strongyloides ratti]